MPLVLYNTLTGEKAPFTTIEPGKAKLYVCGPTVYDYAHMGHIRSAMVFDLLVRHLRASGMEVLYVKNITDIDDKIINRAKEAGENPTELAARFTTYYTEDMSAVFNLVPDLEPRVSDHLKEIIALVETLIEKGAAYESDGDVYFRVSAHETYGKLSGRKLDDLVLGASGRTSDAELARKEHPADFALWKKSPEGEAAWPSPWSQGRPGWHIECSAMSMKYLGETFDLHGGGLDLVFPHHENEIAQSECATGKTAVNFWVHNGFIEVNKEKMSKSLGNFFTAREVFKFVEPEAVRYFMLTTHHRTPLNFVWDTDEEGKLLGFPQIEDAERRIEYLYNTRKRLADIPDKRVVDRQDPAPAEIRDMAAKLTAALDDDLNVSVALAVVNEFLKAVNEFADKANGKKGTLSRSCYGDMRAGFAHIERVLGLGSQKPGAVLNRIRDRRAAKQGITGEWVHERLAARAQARKDKDFAQADAIRDELTEAGIELLDTPEGTDWRMR